MRGEPDFATAPHIVEAAVSALHAGRTRYPDNRGEPTFREAIAAKLLRDNGLTYDPATEVLATTGATLGLHAALTALLEDGGEVVIPEPIYDAYQSPIRLAGGEPKYVAAELNGDRFSVDPADIEAAITPRTKAILINTPWNPVGTVFRRDELATLADIALRGNLTIISDEIYEAITYGEARHISPPALGDEVRARTVVINSLSKTYAMTGWRAGYCAGPAPLIQRMLLVLQQSSRGPATFVQDAAAVALSGPQACVADMQREYARRRQQVIDMLAGLPRVRVLPPEGGFFAMVNVRETGIPSDEIRRRLLLDAGVAVMHGAAYGPAGEGTLRISFGSGGATLTDGLARLRTGLAAL
jgi:aspartate/methionine/tyrosine aminotransferase